MDKTDIKTLKTISFIGMALGFIGSIISNIAESKQTEMEIEEKVEEKFRLYFKEDNDHEV